jgi:hypothetical protein
MVLSAGGLIESDVSAWVRLAMILPDTDRRYGAAPVSVSRHQLHILLHTSFMLLQAVNTRTGGPTFKEVHTHEYVGDVDDEQQPARKQ